MTANSETDETTIRQLAAFGAAETLKARYFRLMDLKEWDEWEALYSPTAEMDMRGEAAAMAQVGIPIGDGEAWVLRSPKTIRQSVEAALDGVTTVHHGHMVEISEIEPGRLRATWAMEDMIRYPAGRPLAGFYGYGHYHDTYVFRDGRWFIDSVRLARLHVTPLPQKNG